MPIAPLSADQLRWRCPATCLDFSTTADLRPAEGVVGQEEAVEALKFGLAIDAPGQNVYVRGTTGSGRLSLVNDLMRVVRPGSPEAQDRCYVHRFERPDQPRLLTLPAGTAPAFKARIDELVRFLVEDLADLVNTDSLRVRTHDIEAAAGREIATVSDPFDAALSDAGLALVGVEGEDGTEPAILAVIDAEPRTWDDVEELVRAGSLADADLDRLRASADKLEVELEKVSAAVVRTRKRAQRAVRRLVEGEARRVVRDAVADMRRTWASAAQWLDELVEDAAKRFTSFEEHPELADQYRVNVLVSGAPGGPRPVVFENVPTVQNLVGSIDPAASDGTGPPAHLGIHAGALVRADGGTLVLMARDVLAEAGAWAALTRTLRTSQIELSPQELMPTTLRMLGLKPEPVPVRVKVVLVGDHDVWYALDDQDPDFPHLFKVLVDFDDVLPRDATGVAMYGRVIARIARDEGLPAFTSAAVGALVEQGAREAEQANKLTARFGRVADVAREAAFMARGRGVRFVDRDDVERALLMAKRRADLPGRRFRDQISTGRVRIRVSGEEVGQVNGLAVVQAGPLVYGFPSRITATVGPGTAGTVHVEREAELSGHIHTKGFLIVRGLARHLLRTDHALTFDASITHEQSYGGIDGDSASAAEFVCLLSALTGVPARQGLAMTGAVDQHGNVLPVGSVNEKIEGFFDACAAAGLDGTQGVVVPKVNAGDLQLRRDVAGACKGGRFAVYGVDRIEEAIELLLHLPAGVADGRGRYPEGTLLARAVARAEALWSASYTASPVLPVGGQGSPVVDAPPDPDRPPRS